MQGNPFLIPYSIVSLHGSLGDRVERVETTSSSSSSSNSSSTSGDEEEASDATDETEDAEALLETPRLLSCSTRSIGQAVAAEVRAAPVEEVAAEEAAGADDSAAGSDEEGESGCGAAFAIKAFGVSPDVIISPSSDTKTIGK